MNNQTTKIIVTIMNVLFWVIFIGLSIETGAILVNYFYSVFINPEATYNLYNKLDLSILYKKDILRYHVIMSSYLIFSFLKAFISYRVIKLFTFLKFDKPFNAKSTKNIFDISYFTFTAGIFSSVAKSQATFVSHKIQNVPIEWNTNEMLFFAGLIYIIAVIMQKGTEIQEENDLTV